VECALCVDETGQEVALKVLDITHCATIVPR